VNDEKQKGVPVLFMKHRVLYTQETGQLRINILVSS